MTTGRWRRLLRLLLPVVLLLVAAHTGFWFWAAGLLQDQVEANLRTPPAPGWRISGGAALRDGWPLRVAVHVPDLTVALDATDIPGGIGWSAARVSVAVSMLHPRTLLLDVIGRQVLRLGTAPAIPATAERMRAEVPLEPGVPVRWVTVAVTGLRAELPTGWFGLDRLDLKFDLKPAAPQGEPALTVMLAAETITLPPAAPGQTWPLGHVIARLALEAAVSGPIPRGPHLAERAQGWRDGGGAMELRRLDLNWGELRLAGSATLALDGQLQPMGAATARITGHAETLDALATARLLTARSTLAAKAVLALLARTGPDGGPPIVEVPFSLQNSTLALGRIPLVRVPQLVWPEPR